MSKIILILSLVFVCCQGCTKTSTTASVHVRIFPDSVINTMKGGMGASMHALEDSIPAGIFNGKYKSWGGSAWGANPDPDDTQAWQTVYKMTDWLGLDWCRLEINHRMYEPDQGRIDTTCYEMRILYRWLDYCQSRNIDVLLQEMWPDVEWLAHPSLKNDRIKLLCSAPADFNAWADGFANLVDYLVKKRGYSCIKWLSVANEPMEKGSWWQDANGSPQNIFPAVKAMQERLQKKMLPVQIAGPDRVNYLGIQLNWDIKDYVGAYSFHEYSATFDWWQDTIWLNGAMSSFSQQLKKVKEYKKRAIADGKALFFPEFGSMILGVEATGKGPSTHISFLRDAQLLIRFSNAGVDAFNRWSLLNRGDLDAQWQLINTWDTQNHSILKFFYPQPNAYCGYGLFTRFTSKYSDVVKTEVQGGITDSLHRVFATAYRSPVNKNYSIYITNDSGNEFNLSLDLTAIANDTIHFYKYCISREDEDKPVLPLIPKEIVIPDRFMIDKLPPESVLLISTIKLENGSNGIIND
jgi:hypothetical protein